MPRRRLPPLSALHWALLTTLLVALTAGATTFDRSSWPTVVGDEATYLMQVESLAWDLDVTYTRQDYDRFVRHWGAPPEGLILQKGEQSDRLVYGKPFYYALWAAPFAHLSPTRGPFVANAVLLALASLAAAWSLRPTVGTAAPSWVALYVFGSIAFAHVFWAHLDLFLMSLTALGLALVFGGAQKPSPSPATPAGEPALVEGGKRSLLWWLRWALGGMLLATVAYSRPLYATLLLPALLASARRGRWRATTALVAGTLALTLGTLAVQRSLVGSWTSYGAERRSFNPSTGYPEVDFPSTDWDAMIERWGNASWLKEQDFTGLAPGTPRLWGWNLLYFFLGQSTGLLVYLLPGILGLLTWRARPPGAERWALVAAVALTAFAFFVLRPHNFYGGGGSLGNRYILPIYPALWFTATRPLKPVLLAAAAIVAGPFLWPAWTAPRAYPLDSDGLFRYVAPAARSVLPYETTQSHMKPTGPRVNVRHHGLWLKSLTPALWMEGGGAVMVYDPARGEAELLVGDTEPLGAVHLELADPEGGEVPRLDVEGGHVAGETDLGGGRRRLWIELDPPRARHPMWWTREDFTLYLLRLRAAPTADPVEITLSPAAR